MALALFPALLFIVAVLNASPSNVGGGLSSSGKTMNFVFFFFLLSQCVIVYHLRQISKSLRILVDSQQKEQG